MTLRVPWQKKKEQIEKLKAEEKERRKEKIAKRLQDKFEEEAAYENKSVIFIKRKEEDVS